MIQRYDLVSGFDDCGMEPCDDGDFVRYEDHAIVERHLEAIRSTKVWYDAEYGCWRVITPEGYTENCGDLDKALKAFDELYPVTPKAE